MHYQFIKIFFTSIKVSPFLKSLLPFGTIEFSFCFFLDQQFKTPGLRLSPHLKLEQPNAFENPFEYFYVVPHQLNASFKRYINSKYIYFDIWNGIAENPIGKARADAHKLIVTSINRLQFFDIDILDPTHSKKLGSFQFTIEADAVPATEELLLLENDRTIKKKKLVSENKRTIELDAEVVKEIEDIKKKSTINHYMYNKHLAQSTQLSTSSENPQFLPVLLTEQEEGIIHHVFDDMHHRREAAKLETVKHLAYKETVSKQVFRTVEVGQCEYIPIVFSQDKAKYQTILLDVSTKAGRLTLQNPEFGLITNIQEQQAWATTEKTPPKQFGSNGCVTALRQPVTFLFKYLTFKLFSEHSQKSKKYKKYKRYEIVMRTEDDEILASYEVFIDLENFTVDQNLYYAELEHQMCTLETKLDESLMTQGGKDLKVARTVKLYFHFSIENVQHELVENTLRMTLMSPYENNSVHFFVFIYYDEYYTTLTQRFKVHLTGLSGLKLEIDLLDDYTFYFPITTKRSEEVRMYSSRPKFTDFGDYSIPFKMEAFITRYIPVVISSLAPAKEKIYIKCYDHIKNEIIKEVILDATFKLPNLQDANQMRGWNLLKEHVDFLHQETIVVQEIIQKLELQGELQSDFFVPYLQTCVVVLDKFSVLVMQMSSYLRLFQKMLNFINKANRYYKLLQMLASITAFHCNALSLHQVLSTLFNFDVPIFLKYICKLSYLHLLDYFSSHKASVNSTDFDRISLFMAISELNNLLSIFNQLNSSASFSIKDGRMNFAVPEIYRMKFRNLLDPAELLLANAQFHIHALALEDYHEAERISSALEVILSNLRMTDIDIADMNKKVLSSTNIANFKTFMEGKEINMYKTVQIFHDTVSYNNKRVSGEYKEFVENTRKSFEESKTLRLDKHDLEYLKSDIQDLLKHSNVHPDISDSRLMTWYEHIEIIENMASFTQSFANETFTGFLLTQQKGSFCNNLYSNFHINYPLLCEMALNFDDEELNKYIDSHMQNKDSDIEFAECLEKLTRFMEKIIAFGEKYQFLVQIFNVEYLLMLQDIADRQAEFLKIKQSFLNFDKYVGAKFITAVDFFNKYIEYLICMEGLTPKNLQEFLQNLRTVNGVQEVDKRFAQLTINLQKGMYKANNIAILKKELETLNDYLNSYYEASQEYFVRGFLKLKLFKGLKEFEKLQSFPFKQWQRTLQLANDILNVKQTKYNDLPANLKEFLAALTVRPK